MLILQGPFSTFKYPIETGCDWTGIKFSLDGKMMMLTTNGAVIRYPTMIRELVLSEDCSVSSAHPN